MLLSFESMLTAFNNYLIFSYIYGLARNIYYRSNSSYCRYNDFIKTTFTLRMYYLFILSILVDVLSMPLITLYRLVEDYQIYDARSKYLLAYLPNKPPLIQFEDIYLRKEYKYGKSKYKV
jgi:hypothetical protein